MRALVLITTLVLVPVATATPPQQSRALYDVVEVIDGDTIHILRDGRVEKLRLLSVDTEEKIAGRPAASPTKPETVFGQETALWARESLPARIGLSFPNGEERRDAYGRLLCHVILPDGRDFNLLLVELGKSPYFNKYGNSRIDHEAFVRAQEAARSASLGIWDPATNEPQSVDAPAAKRPYDLLLPWWEARADAVESFRRLHARDPRSVVAADDPTGLRSAVEHGTRVQVFGTIARFFEEDDGSLTALFRSADRRAAFRAVLGPRARGGRLERFLRETTEELRQNYLFVEGRLERGERGFRMKPDDREAWRLAGPRPRLPADATSER